MHADCDTLRKMLFDRELDVAHILSDSLPDDRRLDVQEIAHGRLYLMVNTNNPLAARTDVSIEDLRRQPLIVQGDGFDLQKSIIRACYDAGFKANVVCIVPDFLTVTLMVNAGQGVAYYLHPSPRYGVSIAPHVACIPFADPTMGWHYYQARRRCP